MYEDLGKEIAKITKEEGRLGAFKIVRMESGAFQIQKRWGILSFLSQHFPCLFRWYARYATVSLLKTYHNLHPLEVNSEAVKNLAWRTQELFHNSIQAFQVPTQPDSPPPSPQSSRSSPRHLSPTLPEPPQISPSPPPPPPHVSPPPPSPKIVPLPPVPHPPSPPHLTPSPRPLPSPTPDISPEQVERNRASYNEARERGIAELRQLKDTLLAALPPLEIKVAPRGGLDRIYTKETLFGSDCERELSYAPPYLPHKGLEDTMQAMRTWTAETRTRFQEMAEDYRHIHADSSQQIVSNCLRIPQDGYSCGPIAILQALTHTKKMDYFLRRRVENRPTETDEQYVARTAQQNSICEYIMKNRAGTVSEEESERIPRELRERFADCFEVEYQAKCQALQDQADACKTFVQTHHVEPAVVTIAERMCSTIRATKLTRSGGGNAQEVEDLIHLVRLALGPRIQRLRDEQPASSALPHVQSILKELEEGRLDTKGKLACCQALWDVIQTGRMNTAYRTRFADSSLGDMRARAIALGREMNIPPFSSDVLSNVFNLALSLKEFGIAQRSHDTNLHDILKATTVAEVWFETILSRLDCFPYIERVKDQTVTAQNLEKMTAVIMNPPGHFYVYVRVDEGHWREINYGVEAPIPTSDLVGRRIHYGL